MSQSQQGSERPDQAAGDAIGVLLVNLGTPASPSNGDVRAFLKEFLGDPRVVEGNRVLWWLVLNGVILTTRPRRSAKAYAKVWGDDGSPLLTISIRQADALREALAGQAVVELAMRYGKPSIADGLAQLRQAGVSRVLVLPLYPQYSATTTASVFDGVAQALERERSLPELRFVNRYHNDPAYIDALSDSVRAHQAEHGEADLLLMSFHGIPQEYVDRGDPYYVECQESARLLAANLGLDESRWKLSFQSRLGPRQWLQPYTDETLGELAASGTKSVQVICPGFSVDCLETLEEIAIENREVFLSSGGERYEYIPCLNDQPAHIDMMRQLVLRNIEGWDWRQSGSTETPA